MDNKFGEVWKPVGPFRTPTFIQFKTKPLMVGQARRGGLGRRAPPLANTHTEVEVEQHEDSDSSQESNLSQLLDSHHLWSNFQLSAFHVWLSERKIYFSSTLPGPLPSVVSSAFTTGNWLGTETQDVLVTEHPQLSHTAPQLLILISEQLALPENKSLSPSLLVSSAQHRLCSENWTSATRECKYHQLGLWKEVADPLDMTWQQSISSTGQPGLSERGRFWWRFRRNHCFKTKQKIYLI